MQTRKISGCIAISVSGSQNVKNGINNSVSGRWIEHVQNMDFGDVSAISGCLKTKFATMNRLINGYHIVFNRALTLALDGAMHNTTILPRENSGGFSVGLARFLSNDARATTKTVGLNLNAHHMNVQTTTFLSHCAQSKTFGEFVKNCQKFATSRAIWVPFIFLPKQPKFDDHPPIHSKKPQPKQFPFAFSRRIVGQSDYAFAFGKKIVANIPIRDSYMILNEITAFSGSATLNPISASVTCDVSGYCWTGEMTLPPSEISKIGETIGITINGETFVFLPESVKDNRQFWQKSYTISGRSLTAHLGADYATMKTETITQALYAQQIAAKALEDTGFSLVWNLTDWLVPANSYSFADKTPIAVLNDIAQAVGGFVYSDPQKQQLTLAPRWKVAAWNLNNTTEIDVSLPENVIVSISGQSTKSAPCYGVFVAATHENGILRKVIRKGSSGSPEASALSHALYTADAACIAAATAALSQTGDFKTETLSLPICADFALNRANLGEIWRVSEDSSTWNGIVQSVNVSVDWDNDAPRVMQSVQLRRYLSA